MTVGQWMVIYAAIVLVVGWPLYRLLTRRVRREIERIRQKGGRSDPGWNVPED